MPRLAVAGLGLAVVATMAAAQQPAGTRYGDGVKLTSATAIEALVAQPQDYVGKTIRVDGVVTSVCDKAGCWMELGDQKSGKSLRFKVADGVIVFPMSAKGKRASAEGVFEPVSAAMAAEYERDRKEASEGAATKAAAPGYQVKATGAIIY